MHFLRCADHGNFSRNILLFRREIILYRNATKNFRNNGYEFVHRNKNYTGIGIYRSVHGFNSGLTEEDRNSDVKITPVIKSLVKSVWPKDNADLKRRVVMSVGLLVGSKLANVGVPFMMKYTIDSLTDNKLLESLAASDLIFTVPGACILAYGATRVCAFGFNELKNAIFAKVAQENIRKTQLSAFNHIHGLDLNFHLSRRTGMIAKILDRGTRSISFILSTLIFNWIPTLFEMSLVLAVMSMKCGSGFALTAMSCIFLYVIFTFAVTKCRIKYRLAMNSADNLSGSRIIDSLMNYETVKYFNNEKHEHDKLNKILKEYEDASLKTATSLAALNFGQSFIFTCALVGIMMLSASQIMAGTMTIGDLVMVNGLLFQLSIPLYFLGSLYRDIRDALVNLNNLYGIMEEKRKIKDSPNATKLDLKRRDEICEKNYISFKNLSFSYHEDKPILKNINISIPHGHKVALVGGSGSGKSTLSKLLYRFHDPTGGSIYLNGQNINNVTLDTLRSSISVVPQDQVLFHSSIFYNIHYGNLNASEDEVYNAAKVVGLHDIIMNFPNQYNTQVGERGLKLSGGEKQRVAIARAILKKAPIFIYDEATSSLDSILEKKILRTLGDIMKNKTSIVIAHRLSTIVDSDIIYVLKNGSVNEYGTHSDLLKNPLGLYSDLWKKQNDTIYKDNYMEFDSHDGKKRISSLESDIDEFNNAFDEKCGIKDKCCKN